MRSSRSIARCTSSSVRRSLEWPAAVASVGTGAAFSLLPPENATGNYVKVVQRIPVRIAIDKGSDPDHLLRVGMSVVPTIVTGRTLADVLRNLSPLK